MAIIAQNSASEQAARLLSKTGFSMPLEQQPQYFLDLVWKTLPDEGLVGLSTNDSRYIEETGKEKGFFRQFWANAEERHEFDFTALYKMNQSPALQKRGLGSVYWQVASRQKSVLERSKSARGTNDELIANGAIYCDIDSVEYGLSLEDSYNAIYSLPLPPSIVVFSGGGLQGIWLFDKANLLGNDMYTRQFKDLEFSFFKTILEICDPSVMEAARVLRMPGFRNNKLARYGAIGQIIEAHPERVFTMERIRVFAPPLPPKPKRDMSDIKPPENGQYLVGSTFLNHFVQNQPIPHGTRHDAMIKLSYEAARGGIPYDEFKPLLYQLIERNGKVDFEDELNEIIDYAYENVDDEFPAGLWIVKLNKTRDGYERVIDPDTDRKLRDKVTPIDLEKGENDEIIAYLIPDSRSGEINRIAAPEMLPLDDLRKDMQAWLTAFREDNDHASMARIFINQAPPGTGKTYTALRELIAYVESYLDIYKLDPRGRAAYLYPFKMDWEDGREWVRSFGIDPDKYPYLFGFLIARNEDENSKGYCGNLKMAEAFGKRGYNVKQAVCNYCPLKLQCEQSGYLAQFEALKRYHILIARPAHAKMTELMDYRKMVIFDESPVDIVAQPIIVKLEEFSDRVVNPLIRDQFPEESALAQEFLRCMYAVIAMVTPLKGEFASAVNVWRDGFRLMEQIVRLFTVERLEQFFAIDDETVEKMAGFRGMDIETLPPNYLPALMKVLKYEYETYYALGWKEWPTRLFPYGHTLRIHLMEPFAFTKNTLVSVYDATCDPDLLLLAFSDKQGRPRQPIIYDKQILPPATAQTIQYTGSENTKSTLLRRADELKELPVETPISLQLYDDTLFDAPDSAKKYTKEQTARLAEKLRKADNPALAQLLMILHDLADKYPDQLLVIAYKALLGDEDASAPTIFRKWLTNSKMIPSGLVSWFGNTRGRNTWKDQPACVIVGTPRIPPMEVLIQAQIWNWKTVDGKPGTPIQDESKEIILPYLGYVEKEDGKGRGYKLLGYADERANRIFVNRLVSELRQGADRIRPNTSAGWRTIYLCTAIPCTSHVTQLIYMESYYIQLVVRQLLRERKKAKQTWTEADLLQEIIDQAGTTRPTAKKEFLNEWHTGKNDVVGTPGYLETWERSFPYHGDGAYGTTVRSDEPLDRYVGQPMESVCKMLLEESPSLTVDMPKTARVSALLKAYKAKFPNANQPGESTVRKAIEAFFNANQPKPPNKTFF